MWIDPSMDRMTLCRPTSSVPIDYLRGSRSFFNTLSEDNKKQFRFLHVSTDEVYGTLSSTDPAFKETNQYEPNSPTAPPRRLQITWSVLGITPMDYRY